VRGGPEHRRASVVDTRDLESLLREQTAPMPNG
jgi:hypothetical protein